jgi:hypothetical protein
MHVGGERSASNLVGGIGVLLVQGICDVRADDVSVSVGGGGCGGANVNAPICGVS